MWALVAVLALAQRVGGGGTAPAPPPSAEEDDLVAQAFWQGTNLAFAFLDAGTAADPKTAAMVQSWSDRFLRRYEWEGRVVVDYGAASGLLGEWLLQTGKARHYVAVDIADRAVQAARVRLQGLGYHDGHRGRFESLQAPLELCTLSATRQPRAHPPPADTLVSTKTLQHVASISMLTNFLRNVRHSGIEMVMLQLVEGEETSCYGSAQDYAMQSGDVSSVLARLGHWCRVSVEFVQRELAGGPQASLVGGGAGDGLPSYVLEWTEREPFQIPAANLGPRKIGQPPPQSSFVNVYLGFRRVPPKASHGVGRVRTGGGQCVICLPQLLAQSVDGGSETAASCATGAAQAGHDVMGRESALLGGVIAPDQHPAGVAPMVTLLQRTAAPFASARVVLILLPGTSERLLQAFNEAVSAASMEAGGCSVSVLQPEAPVDASAHAAWAYSLLLEEASADAAAYVLLADLSLFDFKLHAGSGAGLGYGPGRGWQVDGVATTFAHMGWDVMCANGVFGPDGSFYDTRSLRTAQLPDTTSLHAKGLHLSPLVTPFHSLRDEGDAPPIPVQACFGGLMVVRRAAVSAGRCRYEPQAVTWAEAHFGFHECLRAERTRMAAEDMYSGGSRSDGTFVNPAMMVHYDSESSRERCSVAPCNADAAPGRHKGTRKQPCAYELEQAEAAAAARAVLSGNDGDGGELRDSVMTAWNGSHAHKPAYLVSRAEGDCNRDLKSAVAKGDLGRAKAAAIACERMGVSLDADYAGTAGTPLGVAIAQRQRDMVRWLISRGVSVGASTDPHRAAAALPPLVAAARLGESGMLLQMLADERTGGRQWLRDHPRRRVDAIVGLIAAQPTTDADTSRAAMDLVEAHAEDVPARRMKHAYYKGADWGSDSAPAEAAEAAADAERTVGTACSSSPCLNGGTCTDLLEGQEDFGDFEGEDAAEAEALRAFECRCARGWLGAECEAMSLETEALAALEALVGGTYKGGGLDRMWGQVEGVHRASQTPLMLAAQRGWVGGVEALLQLGAKPDLLDKGGHDALHAAIEVLKEPKGLEAARVTAAAAVTSLLVQAGATPATNAWTGVHGRSARLRLFDELPAHTRKRLSGALRKLPLEGGGGRPPRVNSAQRVKRKHSGGVFHTRAEMERSQYSDL